MVTVTELAKQELGKVLSSANIDDPEVALRLTTSGQGQFDLMLDSEKEGDQVVEHEGAKVLLVGEDLSGVLDGVTIDCQETAQGPRLVMSKE